MAPPSALFINPIQGGRIMGFVEIVTADEKSCYEHEESKFYYRRFDNDVYETIRKKYTKTKGWNARANAPKVEVNEAKINEELFNYILIDWDDVYYPKKDHNDPNEKLRAVPCTDEFKKHLPSTVKTAIINLADAESTQGTVREAEKKTSKNTADT